MEESLEKLTMAEPASPYTGPKSLRTVRDGIHLGRLAKERKIRALEQMVDSIRQKYFKPGDVMNVVFKREDEDEDKEINEDEDAESDEDEEENDEKKKKMMMIKKKKMKKINDSDEDED
ncbi:THO complex subunit MFT1-like [Papaver somniferum]|uniref:THO complex subunit MFT1-like n=1 Tax=Papaver somniferum TaxID=3469 RepID=UPI000E6FA1BD|nr:THO complex subunit MFT1-like [Papaver somniferum]